MAVSPKVRAQPGQAGLSVPEGSALDEAQAYGEARQGNHIRAREMAERIVRANPRSFAGHYVLGYVHHFGEADFPRALYHLERALALFEAQHGGHGGADLEPGAPIIWHARILHLLIWTHGSLEDYQAQIDAMAAYSERYEPVLVAERAWPFMKMRRFDEAREAAELAMAMGDPRQTEVALNALCAIEFEAGNETDSYRYCEQAMNLHGANPEVQSAVDFTNFAESARSLFRLDEAERVGLLATRAEVAWFGNPWVEMSDLYIREGRFPEAVDALRRIPTYQAQRPPHVRFADLNEGRRALSSLYLVVDLPEEAARVSGEALLMPDRRAHNSRDPEQDRAILALIHRRAQLSLSEHESERAASLPFYERPLAWALSAQHRFEGWLAARQAARALADEERLVGIFQIGRAKSAIIPPWLVGELVEVLGAGIVRESIRRARAQDPRRGSDAYYDAVSAEAALASGDLVLARRMSERSLAGLGRAELLLRARVLAFLAETSRRADDLDAAAAHYAEAFQTDPGVFRRLGWPVPVRVDARGEAAEEAASMLTRGPRFEEEDQSPLILRVEERGDGLRGCLLLNGELGCGEVGGEGEPIADASELPAQGAEAIQRAVFAPRIDLSQMDISSLDGSTAVTRDPLESLLGGGQGSE